MKALRIAAIALLLASVLSGTWVALAPLEPLARIDDYYVLAADFHVHMFPGDDTNLAPWDAVFEARRNGLDVVALTGHNQTWAGKIGRWATRFLDRPLVIAGEEIQSPDYHLLGIGVRDTIDWRLSASEAIEEIHRQGGVAIAAHPTSNFWPAYETTLDKLDGSEVLHPLAFVKPEAADEFRQFNRRAGAAAIGDSDWHTTGPIGLCRTFVFASAFTQAAVLDAIRDKHTVVFDGRDYFGDPNLIRLLQSRGAPPTHDVDAHSDSFWVYFSRVSGSLAMFAIIVGRNPRRRGDHVVRT